MFAEPIESVTRLVTPSKGLIGQGQASKAHILELSELTEELSSQTQSGPYSSVAHVTRRELSAQGRRMGSQGTACLLETQLRAAARANRTE